MADLIAGQPQLILGSGQYVAGRFVTSSENVSP